MAVFRIGFDCTQNYEMFVCANNSDCLPIADWAFKGTTLNKPISIIELERRWYSHTGPVLKSDFTCLYTIPLFRARAVEFLNKVLNDNGQLKQLEFEKDLICAYRVTTLIDCIDRKNSNARFDGGTWISDYRILAFIENRLKDAWIFRVPEMCTGLFCTDRFVQLVKQLGLVGFSFAQEWPVLPKKEGAPT